MIFWETKCKLEIQCQIKTKLIPALGFLLHTALISCSVFWGGDMLIDLYNICLTSCDSWYDSETRTQEHFCDRPANITWPPSNHEETPDSASKGPFHPMNGLDLHKRRATDTKERLRPCSGVTERKENCSPVWSWLELHPESEFFSLPEDVNGTLTKGGRLPVE